MCRAKSSSVRVPDQAGINGLRKFSFTIKDGQLRRPVTGGVLGSFKGQRVDFVITMEGQLVLGRGHSVLSDGCPVRFAGELKFNRNGKLIEINNNFGHYQPRAELTQKAKEYLELLGIDVSDVTIVDAPGS